MRLVSRSRISTRIKPTSPFSSGIEKLIEASAAGDERGMQAPFRIAAVSLPSRPPTNHRKEPRVCWKSLGYVNQAKWRMGVVPLGDELGFGVDNALLLGNLGPNGKY